MASPTPRRACVEHVGRELDLSERKACAVLRQHRSTQRQAPRAAEAETALTADIVELAKRFGRYGFRRITALPRDAARAVNRKRLARVRGIASGAEGSGGVRDGGVWPFDGNLRDELLNGELFDTRRAAPVLIEEWRQHDDRVPPHAPPHYRKNY